MPIGSEVTNRAQWLNRRVIFGILLVVLAGLLTFLAIRFAGHTERYLAAKDTLIAGQALTADNLVEVESNPGPASAHYFKSGSLPSSLVVLQTIHAGELVARGSVSEGSADVKQLVVPLSQPLPSGVEKGDYLEIWQLPSAEGGIASSGDLPQSAQKIASQTVLVARKQSDSGLGGNQKQQVEVLVPAADLQALLGALGRELPLVAIPEVS